MRKKMENHCSSGSYLRKKVVQNSCKRLQKGTNKNLTKISKHAIYGLALSWALHIKRRVLYEREKDQIIDHN